MMETTGNGPAPSRVVETPKNDALDLKASLPGGFKVCEDTLLAAGSLDDMVEQLMGQIRESDFIENLQEEYNNKGTAASVPADKEIISADLLLATGSPHAAEGGGLLDQL